MTLSSLILSLHLRPTFHPLPALFSPLLAFSSYLTLAGFKTDGAGMTAAWSGIYVLLASRRSPPGGGTFQSKFLTLRGGVRGLAMGLGILNTICGAYVYATGDRKAEEEERREVNRWGCIKTELNDLSWEGESGGNIRHGKDNGIGGDGNGTWNRA